MTIFKLTTAALTAAVLTTTPIMAQVRSNDAPAERAVAPTGDSERMFGGNLLVSLAIIAGVVAAIILLAENDEDEPASP